MADDPTDPEWTDDPGADTPRGQPRGTAGWQKALLVVGLLVLLGVGVLLVTGDHGPARHAPQDAPAQDADAGEDHDPSQFDH